ncbi:MAG TPA: histidine phosphatase family protein [Gaiellaceae bacterium]|nr:histidine phosphatase family protein [Gaiellaceae bacterium]
MTTEIVFETHSISTDNEAGIATGWLPGELSEEGRRLARRLGERRRRERIDAVYTSDLRRAVETAELAFGDTGIPIHRDPRLRECDYGVLNGGPIADVERERERRIDEPFPGGESYRQAVERMRSFLTDLAAERGSGRVVLIGHGATLWALEHLLEGRPLEELATAPFDWQEGWIYELTASTESTAARSDAT